MAREIVDYVPHSWGMSAPAAPAKTEMPRWSECDVAGWPESVLDQQLRALHHALAAQPGSSSASANLTLVKNELRRRAAGDPSSDGAQVVPGERHLERLERKPGEGIASAERPATSGLLASPAQRLGKGAVRMAKAATAKATAANTRRTAGAVARGAAAKVAHLFASEGERKALLALSRVSQRALTHLQSALPARVEAHVLEHTREIPEKAVHSLFAKGTTIAGITDLVRSAIRSGTRPVLSVGDDGALAFVFEREFPHAIGSKGEKLLRVVVDLEGRLVSTFPVAADRKLTALTVRGIAVMTSVASAALVTALAESEGEAAVADTERRNELAQRSTWYEDALEFLGPYGVFESSPIALEPNFPVIHERIASALSDARSTLGRELTADEDRAIRQSIYDVWAHAVSNA